MPGLLSASKEEAVAFNKVMDGFEADEFMTKLIPKENLSDEAMERQRDQQWFPEPHIQITGDGMDATAGFAKTKTQLSVPASIAYHKNATFTLDAKELRDQTQDGRLGEASKQALGAAINQVVITDIAKYATLIVQRPSAASGYDDIGAADVMMDEQGIMKTGRKFGLSSRDWISAAGNLASREDTQKDSATMDAYRASMIGKIAGMEGFRLPWAKRILAATGGAITISTLDGALNYYIPKTLETTATDEIRNHDNRFQTVTVSDLAASTVKANDKFTIANVWAVDHVSKQVTPQLKTFTVISVDVANDQLVICPPIISNQVANDASEQYQNVSISAKSATAAITWLNTADAYLNPFWHESAIRILPGRLVVPKEMGMMVMQGTTKSGLQIVMSRQGTNETYKFRYRFDVLFGVAALQPQMIGGILFSQT